ncbi:hypothetical protein [Methylobacterium persicinum]|uniref:Pyruvate/2-oxoglutarate dehydrogenase complex dihydrolipoamide acyltransferase (E2) component n=1 Tax=Methylobacterium persicinum TaxID=374426 RepID=A0ABU0HSC6_9HYPH|nr:hypothetical protein [Methylobacterium persicinum]MDQ0445215.1 pyruvate/2-oxoglutarate dehydrogenase complex dihydrolipoamide acyltransferase (E2) component [Methylobacterium persicinum]GJE37840.1 hypothetical protein KHHGKMAE_1902 [Methylobacterium persicinum]
MLDNETEAAPEADREATPASQTPEGSPQESQDGADRPEGEEATSGEAEAAAEPEAKPERAKTPEWLQRRFDEMTRQRHEEARRAEAAERRAAELEARLRRVAGGEEEQQAEQQPQRRPEGDDAALNARAAAIVARRAFDQACNTVVEQGAKEYADFNDALSTFRAFGGLDPALAQAAIDAGNAHKTLYHLGTNPEEYERILQMPERQQAIALARLSDKLSAPPPPKALSKAPPPIAPVGSNGGRNEITDPDKLSDDEWFARRRRGEIK